MCKCADVPVRLVYLMNYAGVIVAVLGMERDEEPGKFKVEDFCFQELPDQPERTIPEEDRYLCYRVGTRPLFASEFGIPKILCY